MPRCRASRCASLLQHLALPVRGLGQQRGSHQDVCGLVYEGCGHFVPDERPEPLARDLLAFFDEGLVGCATSADGGGLLLRGLVAALAATGLAYADAARRVVA